MEQVARETFARLAADSALCSRCRLRERYPGQRYCRSCRATYMQQWRQRQVGSTVWSHRERLYLMRVRSAVAFAIERGELRRADEQTCECGSPAVVHHHDDYRRALDVRALCNRCHRAWHDEHGPAPLDLSVKLPPGAFRRSVVHNPVE